MNSTSGSKQLQMEWYEEWFDSPYYHILYQYRDEQEARQFIDQLLDRLTPRPGALVLDLACGKGRYSRYLAEKELQVTGLDLSKRSIEYARQFENERLSFYQHDMRTPFRVNYYDFIFNFFTSFGYFKKEKEDLQTLRSTALGLKPNGIFVLDFFNSHYVTEHLLGKEIRESEGIRFYVEKKVKGQHVVKSIDFADKGKQWFFQERVRLYTLSDFERLFHKAGLKILTTYGDYALQIFDKEASPRLILVATCDD